MPARDEILRRYGRYPLPAPDPPEPESLADIMGRQRSAYLAAAVMAQAAQELADRERTLEARIVVLREGKAAADLGWQAFASAGEWVESQVASLWDLYAGLEIASASVMTLERVLGVSVGGVNRGKAIAFVKRCKDQKHAIAFRTGRKR